MTFGSDFHKLLELRGRPEELAKAKVEIGEKFYEMKPEWQAELGDSYVNDIASIFADYMEVYKDHPIPKITEQEFEIPLGRLNGESIIFKGVIDEVYKFKDKDTKEKYIKIGEHKTFSKKPDHNFLIMNTQKCLYAKACHILYDIFPRSVIWDYIHSSPASQPVWLEKSQRFSNAKSDKITPFSWERACIEHDITDPEIIEQKQNFIGNIPNFFFRCELDLMPHMVDDVWNGFVYTCKEIVKQGYKNKTKNITRDCAWCSFREICYTEMTEGNVAEVIEKNYEIVERTDIETERRID